MTVTVLLLLAAMGPAQGTAPTVAPIDLFKKVCTEGSAKLSRKTVAPAELRTWPRAARDALRASDTKRPPELEPRPHVNNITNPTFAVGSGGRLFLLLPTKPSPENKLAAACAIVWKGNHFNQSRAELFPTSQKLVGLATGPVSNPWGMASVAQTDGDFLVSVSTYGGWTVLSTVPRPAELYPRKAN